MLQLCFYVFVRSLLEVALRLYFGLRWTGTENVPRTGGGLIACLSDIDCDASTIGMDAGSCSIVERRPCFLDPLDVSGMTHPVLPVAAGLFCTPPTSSQGINTVSGLVGPTRWKQQALVEYFCADSPLDNYVPGTGGCPGSN